MLCKKCRRELPDNSAFCCWCGAKQSTPQKRKALKRANGMGTVYKLSERRKRPWVAAKKKVIIGYYETKTAALEALEKLSGRTLDERYNMTFADVFEAWKAEHYKEIGEKSIAAYDRAFDVFSSLHRKQFRAIRASDFQEVIDQHIGKSRSSIAKYKLLATQLSDWAIREEIISTNFASFIRLPESKKREKEIFTDEDIAKLEENGSEAAKIILMLIYTGMRIGELFALPLADYHGNYVVGGEKTEAGRNRVIPILPAGRKYFEYFAYQADGDLFLSGYTGQHDSDNFRRRDYYPLLEKLKIERKTPHATRHTYASRARRSGVPPEILQKILGHADYTTTANIYVHTDAAELIAAVENC